MIGSICGTPPNLPLEKGRKFISSSLSREESEEGLRLPPRSCLFPLAALQFFPMFESGKKRNAAKKAYEIAYALFRVSAKIEEASIKGRLESEAVNLLISANAGSYGNAANAVAAIEALVKFAIDLNLMSIANGDVLLREIAGMQEILIECLDKSDEVDVSKFFSPRIDTETDDAPAVRRRETEDRGPIMIPVKEAIVEKEKSANPAGSLKSGNRQIVILDRIRQNGNCKLKELQEILPDCSERTIRYDLEDLIERNLVERIGSGGPAVSYRIRQTV